MIRSVFGYPIDSGLIHFRNVSAHCNVECQPTLDLMPLATCMLSIRLQANWNVWKRSDFTIFRHIKAITWIVLLEVDVGISANCRLQWISSSEWCFVTFWPQKKREAHLINSWKSAWNACCVCNRTDTHTLQELDYKCNSPAGSCIAIEHFQRFCGPPFKYLSEHFVFIISYMLQTETPMSFSISSCSLFYVSTHTHTQGKFAVPKPESDNISFRTIVAETSDCIETVDDAWAKLHDFSTFRNFIFSHLFRRFKVANKPRARWLPAATHCVCTS